MPQDWENDRSERNDRLESARREEERQRQAAERNDRRQSDYEEPERWDGLS